MTDSQQIKQEQAKLAEKMEAIKGTNQLPLNLAAKKFLPPDWQDDTSLHVLSLMRWGISEAGIKYQAISPGDPTHDEMEFMIVHLDGRLPKKVMRYLETVGGELGDDETQITPEEILAAKSPREAAEMLLDALNACMIAAKL